MSQKKSTAADFFLHLLSTVLVYMSMTSLMTLLFGVINSYFPDPASYYSDESGSIRFGIAMLVIAFPVYVWTRLQIRKRIEAESELKELRSRRWLSALTIFVAALVIVISLITLVHGFLNGELTLRFGLKVLVSLIVAIATLKYYVFDSKGEKKRQQILGIIVSVLVLVSIVFGFLVMGSPGEQRKMRLDEQRVYNLQSLQWEIESYYGANNALPETLDSLSRTQFHTEPNMFDPETGNAYGYTVVDETTYSLCATFVTEQGNDVTPKSPRFDNVQWNHGVGEVCFERIVVPESNNLPTEKEMIQ